MDRLGLCSASLGAVAEVVVVTEADLVEALADVAGVREGCERFEASARRLLASVGTEALMAGGSLRQVAAATGYSVSTVRRARLPAPDFDGDGPRPAGWYRAAARPGWLQRYDGERWPCEFRDDPEWEGPRKSPPPMNRRPVGSPAPEPGSAAEMALRLAAVASARETAEAAGRRAAERLARTGTEALMAGLSLRDVAAATGYSASTVQRHRLGDIGPRAGWYPARTRPGSEQRHDGRRWLLEFREIEDGSLIAGEQLRLPGA